MGLYAASAFQGQESGNRKDSPSLALAKRLSSALSKKRLGLRIPKYKSDQRHFSQLLRDYGPELIEKVVNWYVAHLGEPYIPRVQSAYDFNDRFNQILEAYWRDHTQVVVGEITLAVMDRLKYGTWPETVLPALPAAVQRSLDGYTPYRKTMFEVVQRLETRKGERGLTEEAEFSIRRQHLLLNHLFENWLWVPIDFVTQWFWEAPLEGWENWTTLVFTPTCRRFTKEGQKRSEFYMGESKWWDSLAELYASW